MKVTFKTLAPAGPSIHEALDESVLLRLAWIDVMPFDTVLTGPFQDRLAGELGPVVADDASGFAVDPDQGIEFPRHPCPRYAGVGNQGKVLAAEIIVDRQDAELAAGPEWSDRKSRDQRWFGRSGKGLGVRPPRSRLRPRRQRTDRPSSR